MYELTLPNAIRDAAGTWTKRVIIDEMEGGEEDILVDQSRAEGGTGLMAVSGPERITKILSRCTVQVGETMRRPEGKDRYELPDFFAKVWDLGFHSDRVFSMVRLRQLSLGNLYRFDRNCPACKREIKNISIDLSTLAVTSKEIGYVSKIEHEMELPRSRDKIVWKFIQGIDERFVEETMREHKSDFMSVLLWRRILRVSQYDAVQMQHTSPGEVPGGLEYTKRMKALDRRFMTSQFDMAEGGIDTDIQIVCNNHECRTEFTTKLQVIGGDFFFPSATPSSDSSTNARLPSAGTGAPTSSPESLLENGDA